MVDQIRVEYFVLLYSDPNDPVTQNLRAHKLRFTIVGQPIAATDRFVDNDNVKVGREATERILAQSGVSQPAFVMSTQEKSFEKSRLTGYLAVMKGQKLTKYLRFHPQVDGLVFADDVLYIKHAQRLRPLNIPVICFNNSQWMQILLDADPFS